MLVQNGVAKGQNALVLNKMKASELALAVANGKAKRKWMHDEMRADEKAAKAIKAAKLASSIKSGHTKKDNADGPFI